jgi:hypothetical protein
VLGGGLAPVVAAAPRIEVRVQEDLGDFSSTVIEEVGGGGGGGGGGRTDGGRRCAIGRTKRFPRKY